MKRLSEELERQGEAVNFHADLVRQRDGELQEALERVNRANEELVFMEPPSLSKAGADLEVILRVSTADAVSAKGRADDTADESRESATTARVWCLVRYSRVSRRRRQRGDEKISAATELRSDGKGTADDVRQRVNDGGDGGGDDDRHHHHRQQQEENGVGPGRGESEETGDNGPVNAEAGSTPWRVANFKGDTTAGSAGDPDGTAPSKSAEGEAPEQESNDGRTSESPERSDSVAAGASVGNSTGKEVDADTSTPKASEAATETLERSDDNLETVIEWRSQEEVDEWFAQRLASASAAVSQAGDSLAAGGPAAGVLDEAVGLTPETDETSEEVGMPVLDMPLTIQESSAAEVARVKGEFEARLEEARAELNRNTEAYNQYRARVRRVQRAKSGSLCEYSQSRWIAGSSMSLNMSSMPSGRACSIT